MVSIIGGNNTTSYYVVVIQVEVTLSAVSTMVDEDVGPVTITLTASVTGSGTIDDDLNVTLSFSGSASKMTNFTHSRNWLL